MIDPWSISTESTLTIPIRSRDSKASAAPCRNFRQHRSCKFGKRCKFLHEPKQAVSTETGKRGGDHSSLVTPRTNGPRGTTGSAPHNEREVKLRSWKRLLEQGSQLLRPDPTTVARFFQLGLELMDGDVGTTQEIVRLLASEASLSFVKDITDRHLPQLPILAGQRFWNTKLRPFFRLISHAHVVNSAILGAASCHHLQLSLRSWW